VVILGQDPYHGVRQAHGKFLHAINYCARELAWL